ncbi:MAG TPA: LamG-like jellyroll fold domain-containing protein, partial [Candidatus Limnocylindria bacterium]|nr:LamG-like jellyroll fold domain-containing protein [Candidatus Limnocylindria bacterium]
MNQLYRRAYVAFLLLSFSWRCLATDCVVAPTGIINWWPAKGNAADIISANGSGVLTGGASLVTGQVGQAFGFDGVSGRMNAVVTGLTNGNTPHTIEAWVRIDSLPSGEAWILSLGNSGGGGHYWTVDSGGNAYFGASGGGSAVTINLFPGIWQHLAVTFDGSTLAAYLNGSLFSSQSVVFDLKGFTMPFTLGASPDNSGFFDGMVDEASIYNRALSASEISAIYATGTSGKCKDKLPPGLNQQPESTVGSLKGAAGFSVVAQGTAPLSYRWQFNGTNLPGANTPLLVLTNLSQAKAGTYSVIVTNLYGAIASTNAILNVAYPISLGQIVNDGVPFTGAGNLESPGTVDDYVFTAPDSLLVSFNFVSAYSGLYWRLTAPDGSVVFDQPSYAGGRIQLPQPGSYVLRVYSQDGTISGAYSFQASTVTNQLFSYAIGTVVTNGVPLVGEGILTSPGEYDTYSFTAPTNLLANFNFLSPYNGLFWRLSADDGTVVFDRPSYAGGRVTLPKPGGYQLRVYDSGNKVSEPYGFKVTEITDREFAYTFGSVVTNGVPLAGAGTLSVAGAYDTYTFVAPGNLLLNFNLLSTYSGFYWRLTADDGTVVFDRPTYAGGRMTLPKPGGYQLRIYSPDSTLTGDYSFRANGIADEQFAYTLGSVVTNGVPSAGAGNLSGRGEFDTYIFTAPTNLLADFKLLSEYTGFYWRLSAGDGTVVFDQPSYAGGRVILPKPGGYQLRVYSPDSTLTGPYSLRVTGIVDQQFAYSVGSVVTNGVPLTGAGNLTGLGEYDSYTFIAPTNLLVNFSLLSPYTELYWRLSTEDGTVVVDQPTFAGGRITLPRQGNYQLRIYSPNSTASGPYSFKLSPVSDEQFTYSLGTVVTNGIPLAGEGLLETFFGRDTYTFQGTG